MYVIINWLLLIDFALINIDPCSRLHLRRRKQDSVSDYDNESQDPDEQDQSADDDSDNINYSTFLPREPSNRIRLTFPLVDKFGRDRARQLIYDGVILFFHSHNTSPHTYTFYKTHFNYYFYQNLCHCLPPHPIHYWLWGVGVEHRRTRSTPLRLPCLYLISDGTCGI